jgi:hypothetical protein
MKKVKTPPSRKEVAAVTKELRDVLFDELDHLRQGKTNAAHANAIARNVRRKIRDLTRGKE